MAATRTTTRHQLNRTHELANVQPQTALQTPQKLPAPALATPHRGHAGNQNPLVSRIDAPAKARNGEGIGVALNHVTMTEVLDVTIHETAIDAIETIVEMASVMTATTAEAEGVQAIVLDATLSPIHLHQTTGVMIDAMTGGTTDGRRLHAVTET